MVFIFLFNVPDWRSVEVFATPAKAATRRARGVYAALLLSLYGCAPSYLDQRGDEPQNAADAVKSADLTPRFPQPYRQPSSGGAGGGGFLSFGALVPNAPAPAAASDPQDKAETPNATADGYTLNFDNTPLPNAAKAVLNDILGLRYTTDPRAQGALNLSSTQPIAKKDVLSVFESALRAINVGLVKEAGGYRLTPIGEGGVYGATDAGSAPGDVQAGYGTTVIPLRYVSAPAIVHLLEGLSSRPSSVRADTSGRVIVVVGTSQERLAAVETVKQFDVDWMRGQSVGLVPVRNGSSTAIAGELEKILDTGESGLGHDLVKVQDVTAQNAVLIVASQPRLLKAAANWVQRLDAPNLSASGVHVYKVRYGDAKQLAHLLTAMFGSGANGDADADQTAPGQGAKHLTPSERLTGGATSSTSGGVTGGQAPGANTGALTPGASGGSAPYGGLQTAALSSAFASAGDQNGGALSLPNVRITADVDDNSVLVYASAENFRIIERALGQIDRPRAQVAIDVTIAEVALNDQLNYGVQFYLNNHLGSIVNSNTGLPPTSSDVSSGFNVFVGNSATPHAIINALHQLTDVRILSNPSLVVIDNQQATLEVGDQVPVSTGSAAVLSSNNAVVNTVDYKNTGIILDVLPHVSPDNTVQLEISQEISNVVNPSTANTANASASETNLTPTISERKIKSQISVASGQMVMLAGLVSETQNKSRSGIPGLDQLPLVGGAFGSTGKTRARTELIILIKPQIIHNSVDAARVAEQLRAKMRGGRIDALSLPNALQVGAKPF